MTRKRGRPRLGKTGCLFWVFIFLVIIVIILYRGKGSLKDSFSFLKNRTAPAEERKGTRSIQPEEPSPDNVGSSGDLRQNGTALKTPDQESGRESGGTPSRIEPSPKPADEVASVKTEETPKKKEPAQVREKILKAPLYYVKIESDGSARIQPVIRSVSFTDSPITQTIESLLTGPTSPELENGLVSFIPAGTRLLSARIQNGHLTLNFSDTFENNYNGREAIEFQLSQVMLTSFEFKQVTSLSILINSKNKRYITGEGIPLKEVYTKDDLSQLNTRG
jgi:germination protein M